MWWLALAAFAGTAPPPNHPAVQGWSQNLRHTSDAALGTALDAGNAAAAEGKHLAGRFAAKQVGGSGWACFVVTACSVGSAGVCVAVVRRRGEVASREPEVQASGEPEVQVEFLVPLDLIKDQVCTKNSGQWAKATDVYQLISGTADQGSGSSSKTLITRHLRALTERRAGMQLGRSWQKKAEQLGIARKIRCGQKGKPPWFVSSRGIAGMLLFAMSTSTCPFVKELQTKVWNDVEDAWESRLQHQTGLGVPTHQQEANTVTRYLFDLQLKVGVGFAMPRTPSDPAVQGVVDPYRAW